MGMGHAGVGCIASPRVIFLVHSRRLMQLTAEQSSISPALFCISYSAFSIFSKNKVAIEQIFSLLR